MSRTARPWCLGDVFAPLHLGGVGYYDWLAQHFSNETVLDLGSGSGQLSRHRANIVSVDVSPAASHADCALVCAEAAALPFASASFAAVVCSMVLPLVEKPRVVMAEIARVLSDAGTLIATLGGGPATGGAYDELLAVAVAWMRQNDCPMWHPAPGTLRRFSDVSALFCGWQQQADMVYFSFADRGHMIDYLCGQYEFAHAPPALRSHLQEVGAEPRAREVAVLRVTARRSA